MAASQGAAQRAVFSKSLLDDRRRRRHSTRTRDSIFSVRSGRHTHGNSSPQSRAHGKAHRFDNGRSTPGIQRCGLKCLDGAAPLKCRTRVACGARRTVDLVRLASYHAPRIPLGSSQTSRTSASIKKDLRMHARMLQQMITHTHAHAYEHARAQETHALCQKLRAGS